MATISALIVERRSLTEYFFAERRLSAVSEAPPRALAVWRDAFRAAGEGRHGLVEQQLSEIIKAGLIALTAFLMRR